MSFATRSSPCILLGLRTVLRTTLNVRPHLLHTLILAKLTFVPGINVKVTGSGTASPCADGTATCKTGTALYTSTDPGILVNIYQTLDSYTIPGPAVYKSASSKSSKKAARSFTA